MNNTGIKQGPLEGAVSELHGKQVLGPKAAMYSFEADGQGGWREIAARPVYRHEARPTGEYLTHTGAPVLEVWSIDTTTGRETRWLNTRGGY
jgi:hypothetical protein